LRKNVFAVLSPTAPSLVGSVLLRKFSTVGLFQNLTHLDPLFSTTSVALFLKKMFLPRFHRLLHRSRVSSSPQIPSGGRRRQTEARHLLAIATPSGC